MDSLNRLLIQGAIRLQLQSFYTLDRLLEPKSLEVTYTNSPTLILNWHSGHKTLQLGNCHWNTVKINWFLGAIFKWPGRKIWAYEMRGACSRNDKTWKMCSLKNMVVISEGITCEFSWVGEGWGNDDIKSAV